MSFTESSHISAKNRTVDTGFSCGFLDNTRKYGYLILSGLFCSLDELSISVSSMGKKVMAFGTFDLFHPGHVYYLSEAESLGEMLTIVIARDARVKSLKQLTPHDDEDTRLANVAHGFRNAEVILGDEVDIFAPVRLYSPDILAFGYDQRVPEEKIRELFPHMEIVRIGGYETQKWKSSLLRENEKLKIKN